VSVGIIIPIPVQYVDQPDDQCEAKIFFKNNAWKNFLISKEKSAIELTEKPEEQLHNMLYCKQTRIQL
jgi:hypothetical protein